MAEPEEGSKKDSAEEALVSLVSQKPGSSRNGCVAVALPQEHQEESRGELDGSPHQEGSSGAPSPSHQGSGSLEQVVHEYGQLSLTGGPLLRGGPEAPGTSKPNAPGYRKLWGQILSGQRTVQAPAQPPCQDLTVEDLVRAIISLPSERSAVEAVSAGLKYLDSSALAALLKELGRQGLAKRAVEIFDWLRSLDRTHELYTLLDTYAYTTSISICASNQQLRRALELLGEMKSKGIPCNVHTYSSLINVCVKSNELDLVHEVYAQMVEDGCTPNLVTYNTLIDLYVKTGQWREAVKTLDTLEKQGILPEVRTYNTIISACNKSGEPEEGMRIYERMVNGGIQPSATTFTALISAYGKKGQVEKAMAVFQDMVRRGCEPNVITYSSLISACERSARWELALELFARMNQEGCKPNVVTYNSLIAACAHGGHWEKASELFSQMSVQDNCHPDSITFNALITSFERAGQWRRALSAFEQMQAEGCHPDSVVYNTLLEALWHSGVLAAQARGVQLWALASRYGHFRIYQHTKAEGPGGATRSAQSSCVVFTCGAAAVTVLRWLADIRYKLVGLGGGGYFGSSSGIGGFKDGMAGGGYGKGGGGGGSPGRGYIRGGGSSSPGGGGDADGAAPSGGLQRPRVQLSLQKGKHNRAEQPSQQIYDAISTLLEGHNSPFKVQLLGTSTVLDADAEQLESWLRSPVFTPLLHMVQGGGSRQLSTDLLVSEDLQLESRCIEAFGAVQRYEQLRLYFRGQSPLQPLQPVQRGQLATLALNWGFSFRFRADTIYDALELFQRVLAAAISPPLGSQLWSLVLCACLVIAGRQGEMPGALPPYEQVVSVTGFSAEALLSIEQTIYLWLQHDTSAISALRVAHLYLERLGLFHEPKQAAAISSELQGLMFKVWCSSTFANMPPSALAAAVVHTTRRAKGLVPLWPSALAQLTGITSHHQDYNACLAKVAALPR